MIIVDYADKIGIFFLNALAVEYSVLGSLIVTVIDHAPIAGERAVGVHKRLRHKFKIVFLENIIDRRTGDVQAVGFIEQGYKGLNQLIGDIIELQFLGNSYNPNLGSAISLVLMVVVLLCMSIMSNFDDEEMEGRIL